MTLANPWKEWLDDVPRDKVELLAAELITRGFAAKKNGVPTKRPVTQEAGSVTVVRPTVEDCMITNCPPYEDVFKLLDLYSALCFRQNLLIKGPKGTGKTLSIFTFSAMHQIPVVVIECSEDTKKRDLVGSFYLKGKETPYILGVIPTAIDIANEYGKAILLFEEINALTPQTQKDTNAALDFRRMVSIPQIGKRYQLQKDKLLWAVATMNPSVYGGTYDINEDLRSRWDEAAIGYPPPGLEKKIIKANIAPPPGTDVRTFDSIIDQCIRLAGETRQEETSYALSTRDVVRLVEDIHLVGLDNALQLLVCKFEGDDLKTMPARVASIFLNVRPGKTWSGKVI